ncbi:MAG TPA: SDR family NAD(P)-dependent oxidoreductase [Pyrinomonadaceae bacterium]|nr:SDR family NAD(P)-dependent oxidoreductase [Pyrinomonadaceae bacterium]
MKSVSWDNRKVLVTGGGGFIGSHLVERLVELGATTRALVHYNSNGRWGWLDDSRVKNEVEVILGDVRDPDSLERAIGGVDTIFHLAALIAIPYSYHAPLSYIRTNIEGTANVLQAALKKDVSLVVHTSTSEVYGTAREVPISENHPLQGQSPYSASKIGADKIAESFHASFGLPIVTVRPFNTYGPRQSARAVIPTIVSQALTETAIRLGNLSPTRDLNYVADTVDGFVCAADCPRAVGSVVNLGTGTEVSIEELARKILRMMGKSLPLVSEEARRRPEVSEVERLCADNTRARELLSWQPRHSLEAGLEKTIEWLQENRERYRPGVYAI